MNMQEALEGLVSGRWSSVQMRFGVSVTRISYSEEMFDFYDEMELEWGFTVKTYHVDGCWEAHI